MRIRSRGAATMLACVERLVTEVQRSFAPFILERQVTAAADIQACLVTGSSQPTGVHTGARCGRLNAGLAPPAWH